MLRKLFSGILLGSLCCLTTLPAWAYTPKVLKVGFVPSENLQSMLQKTQPIVAWMRATLGMEVVAFVASDYAGVVEAMRARKVDVAFFAPGGFVLAEKQAGAQVILKSVRKGKTNFFSAIITRRDSGLNRLEDLKGHSFAFVDPTSVSGAIFPKAMLLSKGIHPERDFSQIIYAGGHDATVMAVLHRKVDAAATFANDTSGRSGAWTDFLKNREDQAQIKVIAYTKPTPSDNICVSKDLDRKLVNKVKKCFLSMSNSPEGIRMLKDLYHIDGYASATSAEYQPVRDAFGRVGIKIR